MFVTMSTIHTMYEFHHCAICLYFLPHRKPIIVDDADWLPLELGTIVMVTETVHMAKRDGKSCWHGMKVNPKNGNLLQSGCLASGLK